MGRITRVVTPLVSVAVARAYPGSSPAGVRLRARALSAAGGARDCRSIPRATTGRMTRDRPGHSAVCDLPGATRPRSRCSACQSNLFRAEMGFAPQWFIWASRVSLALDCSRAPNQHRSACSDPRCSVTVCEGFVKPLTDSPVPGPVCRYYLPRLDDRSHVLIGQWTTATLRMTCLTGGRTPCSAATGIPGRPATSSSPTCRARAALTKASPDTPWSGARPTAAAQPGTARDTTRPTRHPPAPPGSQVGSHHHRRRATQSLLKRSTPRQLPGIQLQWPTPADRQDLVRIEVQRSCQLLPYTPRFPFQRCAPQHLTHMPNSGCWVSVSLARVMGPGCRHEKGTAWRHE